MTTDRSINIVGTGLAGSLLATLLARRGFAVTLYDRRPDPRGVQAERGRSINLALASRGISALERAGIMDRIWPLLIPMRGRMVHELSGETAFHPYGQREHEVTHSVGRAALNRLLVEEAARLETVTLHFGQTCLAALPSEDVLRFRDNASGSEYDVALSPTIAADGAGSAVRAGLAATGYVSVREEPLGHDYKELTLPPVQGRHALERNALHLWPRGGFMLIALPNTDGSFTATLFLPRTGSPSFATLSSPQAISDFFQRQFPDAVPLIPDLLSEFRDHPQGQLGTVHAEPWRVGGRLLLLGDAAHAMVPFHGQGMNAAFEDCLMLDELLDGRPGWEAVFTAFERERRPDAAAIAQMAVENYIEMRDTVRDDRFVRHKKMALELERRFPDRFVPRYSMVMFHPEIPYAEALRRGAVQNAILAELDAAPGGAGQIDFDLAGRLIRERLSPLR